MENAAMQVQGWPLYAAGLTERRRGKVYAVVGWMPYRDDTPGLIGSLPVLVELNGGALAEKYDTDKGITRLFATESEARQAAFGAVPGGRR